MSLINEMIATYFKETDRYYHDYTVQDAELLGPEIHARIVSPCGYYRETVRIDLLELLAWLWVYEK